MAKITSRSYRALESKSVPHYPTIRKDARDPMNRQEEDQGNHNGTHSAFREPGRALCQAAMWECQPLAGSEANCWPTLVFWCMVQYAHPSPKMHAFVAEVV